MNQLREMVKKVPIPTAGVALGCVALGNLLAPFAPALQAAFAAVSLTLVCLVVAKVALFPGMVRQDMHNPIMASVSATFFMTLMQLAALFSTTAFGPALALWWFAVVGHLILMAWFTAHFIVRFRLAEVFPTYFICYVGIIVASLTSPSFGTQATGVVLFWLGFASYAVLLAVVTARYLKHEIPESARPLFCIYSAPMSLSLAGYLAVTPEPNLAFAAGMAVLAQILFLVVLLQVPRLVRLQFYPSFAAMTFPFVITATALGSVLTLLEGAGWFAQALPLLQALQAVWVAEVLFAIGMVCFVVVCYVRFFLGAPKKARPVPVLDAVRITYQRDW